MPPFGSDPALRRLMGQPSSIRCVALLGDAGHGKTSLAKRLEAIAEPVETSKHLLALLPPAGEPTGDSGALSQVQVDNGAAAAKAVAFEPWQATERLSVSMLLVDPDSASKRRAAEAAKAEEGRLLEENSSKDVVGMNARSRSTCSERTPSKSKAFEEGARLHSKPHNATNARRRHVGARLQVEVSSPSPHPPEETEVARASSNTPSEAGTLVYLVDTPGLTDFAAEVSAALRVVDGAVLVVDACEGLAAQGERVLREAFLGRVRPVLYINGLDRCLLDLGLDAETMEERFHAIVDRVNEVLESLFDELLGDCTLRPEAGDVIFGSCRGGWAFSLPGLAAALERQGAKVTATDLWRRPSADGSSLLVSRLLSPLVRAARALQSGGDEAAARELTSLVGAASLEAAGGGEGPAILDKALQQWAGKTADVVFELLRSRTPSPSAAQSYREDGLYRGPADDVASVAMRNCDAKGPVLVNVVRLLPLATLPAEAAASAAEACDNEDDDSDADLPPQRELFALARVFSGTLRAGVPLRVHCPAEGGRPSWRHVMPSAALPVRADGVEVLSSDVEVSCGNIVALRGLAGAVRKEATLTDKEGVAPLLDLRISALARPVLRVVVRPTSAKALPRLNEALKMLNQVDPVARCASEEWGEHTVIGAGERHIEACLRYLHFELAANGLSFSASAPALGAAMLPAAHDGRPARYGVTYRETVRSAGEVVCVDAPHGMATFSAMAEPLDRAIAEELELGLLNKCSDHAERARSLGELCRWTPGEWPRVWCFGPSESGPNIVLGFPRDGTATADAVEEDADQDQIGPSAEAQACVEAACQWATLGGALCEEPLRAVLFRLRCAPSSAGDASDEPRASVLRGAGNVVSAAKRCLHAAQLAAVTGLQEPVLRAEVVCSQESADRTRAVLGVRGAQILAEEQLPWSKKLRLLAELRAASSLHLQEELASDLVAPIQLYFNHWVDLPGDPSVPGVHQETVLGLRKWRNLREGVPESRDILESGVSTP
eukprot:TRINITY_DN365_c0_g1_i4.p1 TRINITY_DN365_c0_g1~~TRINITY_DN365_c0_g1_i4.p1  ORF type:complete len:1010 (+),score=223.83 TRINITY_DN365_c0_g1_i4:2018-5047(+)